MEIALTYPNVFLCSILKAFGAKILLYNHTVNNYHKNKVQHPTGAPRDIWETNS